MIQKLLERDLIPEILIRRRIRSLLKKRLRDEYRIMSSDSSYKTNLRKSLSSGAIAIETKKANDQHYEVPSRFYELVLGRNLKYSCGHWDTASDLDSSEVEMLDLTCDRAELSNGMEILELGCGWGSLTLFMAKKFPDSKITAVSNSHSQAAFIKAKASADGLHNITVLTSDINDLTLNSTFDRIVSVEMFEHMRNYELLLKKVKRWMKDEGKLFIHIFTHKEISYRFDVIDDTDWMAKYFFSGGIMPSDDLLYQFDDILKVKAHWKVNGKNYGRTSEAWLSNLKNNKNEVISLFRKAYPGQELKWFVYWKIFFMSCAELWNYNKGEEWIVSHYLLEK